MAEEKKSDRVPGISLKNIFGGRPWILFILIGFVLIFLVVGIVAMTTGNRQTGAATVAPGTLTAAIVVGDDRFAYHDEEGNLVGIEPTLAGRLADAEGLTLSISEVSTGDEALTLLNLGAADVAFGRISSDATTGFATSTSYGRSGLFLVTPLHDYTASLNLMTGYSVGVMLNVKGTATSIPNYDFVTPKDYESAVTLGEDIRDRVINMGIMSERDAVNIVKNFPNDLQMQQISDGPLEYYVAAFPADKAVHATILDGVMASPAEEVTE